METSAAWLVTDVDSSMASPSTIFWAESAAMPTSQHAVNFTLGYYPMSSLALSVMIVNLPSGHPR